MSNLHVCVESDVERRVDIAEASCKGEKAGKNISIKQLFLQHLSSI